MESILERIYDCGLASTPSMFMTTVFDDYGCDGAIMITASHLPFNRNGFKYFDKDGGLNKGDISRIIAIGEALELREKAGEPQLEKRDLLSRYSAHLRDKIIRETEGSVANSEKPLAGLKIVVDAGNGAGGFYATHILEPLGADISASQFLEPDGTFPNHAPNPENKQAMEAICNRVKESGADFGIIFDTDVDRSSAVDGSGKEINRNGIVAMAAALIAKEHPQTTVVTDSITSDELTVYLEKCLGLKHLRFKRGYKNVINKAMELNEAGIDSQLAIETSGHAAYKENYFLDDGAYLATKIVIKAAQLKSVGADLSTILQALKEPKEAVEYRFPILTEDFGAYGDVILEDLKNWVKEDCAKGGQIDINGESKHVEKVMEMSLVEPNHEGVRINFRCDGLSGWCLLRKSLHDPIMPLNIEVTEGSCDEILTELKLFLGRYDKLDIGGK